MPVVHVLWSPDSGPLCAYVDAALAREHATELFDAVEIVAVEVRDVSEEDESLILVLDLEDLDDAGDD